MKGTCTIIRMIGGLGNQLFQLQYGLKFAERTGSRILLDDSFLRDSGKAHEVLAFPELFNRFEVHTLSWFDLRVRRGVERLFDKVKAPLPFFYEPIFVFKPDVKFEGRKKHYVVDGFWQDKKFLSAPFVAEVRGAISQVRRTQNLKKPDDDAVCIHIRRGDYLTNKHWFKLQQVTLGLDYYEAAIAHIKQKEGLNQFHVYTDDERWAQKMLFDHPEVSVIPSNHLSPSQLLSQMAHYQHFIIANSTLSWWSAVLSNALPRHVICPKQWGIRQTSRDLSLIDWIVI
jgi:hypothetical protein